MSKLSRRLVVALKTGRRPMYRVAQAAGLHPTTLSKLVRGIEPLRKNDPRILRVGRVLGLPRRALFGGR